MGYAEVVDDVTKLFRNNRKHEAATIIPDELVDDSAIVGDLGYVQEQIKAWEAAGVTMMGSRYARPNRSATSRALCKDFSGQSSLMCSTLTR